MGNLVLVKVIEDDVQGGKAIFKAEGTAVIKRGSPVLKWKLDLKETTTN